jgi:tRNA (guanine37-N1)-methyltransferase
VRFDVLTLFPEMFAGYLGQSLLKLAIERGLVQVNLFNIRDWATDKHRVVDDRPYGGGPGMILKPEPVIECVEAVQASRPAPRQPPAPPGGGATYDHDEQRNQTEQPVGAAALEPGHLVMLTPQGRRLTQPIVEELARHKRLVLLCGRYEGFDDRVRQILQPDEISIGDFVLGGGEVAAMVIIDAVIRLVPDVLGHEDSPRDDSFSGQERLLEGAQYTRPREYRGLLVPDVLLNGNHEQIARWRREQSLQKTQERRADLLGKPECQNPNDEKENDQ